MSYEDLKKHLDKFFSDTRRPASDTLDYLIEFRGEVDTLIEMLEGDLYE